MARTHVVKQGECFASIAAEYGFFDGKTLYDDPANQDLKQRRPNPNLLCEGDSVAIPDKVAKVEERGAGAKHRFKLARAKTVLRLVVKLPASYRYELSVGAETFEGSTDGKSPIEHAVPANAQRGELRLWPEAQGHTDGAPALRWALKIGHLDPIDENSGVTGRLANLGFLGGANPAQSEHEVADAIRAFQRAHGLTVNGTIDDALRAKLKREHEGA